MIEPGSTPPESLPFGLSEEALVALESSAQVAVLEAGTYVASRFETELVVEEKEDATRSLVTEVDRESQRLVEAHMRANYPEHALLGEEDPPDADPPAPDFVWAVDPVDGTTNYANALPTYAVSIGVLFRGAPVVAACYIPWPNERGYSIFHARLHGGAWRDDQKIAVKGPTPGPGPQHGRTTSVPMEVNRMFRLGDGLRKSMGDPRSSGSIVYDLLMIASGKLQLMLGGWAAPWDYAGGILIVQEAGGYVMSPDMNEDGILTDDWIPFRTFDRRYEPTPNTMRRLRRWLRPVLAGSQDIVTFAANDLRPRRGSVLDRVKRAFLGVKQI